MSAQTGKAGVADKVKIAAFDGMCAQGLVLLVTVLVDGFRRASSVKANSVFSGAFLIKRCQLSLSISTTFVALYSFGRRFRGQHPANLRADMAKGLFGVLFFVGGGVDVELFFGAGKGDIEQTQIFCRLSSARWLILLPRFAMLSAARFRGFRYAGFSSFL